MDKFCKGGEKKSYPQFIHNMWIQLCKLKVFVLSIFCGLNEKMATRYRYVKNNDFYRLFEYFFILFLLFFT